MNIEDYSKTLRKYLYGYNYYINGTIKINSVKTQRQSIINIEAKMKAVKINRNDFCIM